ncbi:MAG: NADH-quinone oxidoreductase subunit N [Ardenticatenia bacterium]|nr:NADH-quinone oxidoreductase subunit N [Ardenticatenia bacterium]
MERFLAQNWTVIQPALFLVFTGLIVLLVDLWLKDEERDWLAYFSLIGFGGAEVIVVRQWLSVRGLETSLTGFGGMMVLDTLGLLFQMLFFLVGFLAVLMAPGYLMRRRLQRGEFYALLLFATAGMSLLAGAQDLIMLFLGIEVLSIPLYILAGFARPRLDSEEASLKYFLLGAFATGFLLYGTALLYGATGTTAFEGLRTSQAAAAPREHLMFMAGMALVLVGLGFKISMAPFHQWTPDVYEGAPTPVTAFMIAATKAGGMVALIRLLYWGLGPAGDVWRPLLAALAAITMTWGNVGALLQRNIKRMLAYSSIAHAGYLLIGVLSGGIGFVAVLVYLLIYALMNLGAFGVILLLEDGKRETLDIEAYRGLARFHPGAALLMSIFLLSLAGFPPTAGFFGKFFLFTAGVSAGLTWLVIVAVLNSVLSVFYYARVIVKMYMQEPVEPPAFSRSWLVAGALAVAVAGVVLLGLYPTVVVRLITA